MMTLKFLTGNSVRRQARPEVALHQRSTRRSLAGLALAVLLTALSAGWAVADPAPLQLVATTPMPGYTGDFDHFGADVKGGRIYLAAEVNKTVEIFDAHTGARLGQIHGFGHPLVMQYLAADNRLLVTDQGFPDGQPGALQLVDCRTIRTKG